jgi:predicted kinase
MNGNVAPRRVFLLSGVPGSGKSHYVNNNLIGVSATVVSADDFFMQSGEYRFDARRLGDAHAACLRKFVEAVKNGDEVVAVDNTNTTAIEMSPYVALAAAYGYEIAVVRILCGDLELAARRNLHGVPLAAIEAMDRRVQKTFQEGLPPFWKVRVAEIAP